MKLLLLFIAAALVLGAKKTKKAKKAKSEVIETDFVVIGAGMSGIKAADVLHQAGENFVVVEGDSIIGGRVKEVDFQGYTVELGANWIHGPESADDDKSDNPMWKAKLRLGLKGNYSNYYDEVVYAADGNKIKQKKADKWWDRVEDAIEYCNEKSEQMWEDMSAKESWGYSSAEMSVEPERAMDFSIQSCLNHYGYKLPVKGSLDNQMADLAEWVKTDFEFAQKSKKVSNLWGWPVNGHYEHKDFLVTDSRGYGYIIDDIASNFPENSIRLNQKVTDVTYSEKGVTVKTAGGLTVKAKYAICTVSLGVLQHKAIKFNPQFSKEKQNAINGMVMANYAKIYAIFPENFWGDNEVLLFAGKVRHEDSMPWALNLDNEKYFPGSKMLTFHCSHACARRIEADPAKTTQKRLMEQLRKVYGPKTPEPEHMMVTDWSKSKFAYGSYSDWPVGYTEKEHNLMIQNEGRLFFAGEHATGVWYGFLHGAFKSGKQVAQQVLALKQGVELPGSSEEGSSGESSSEESSSDE